MHETVKIIGGVACVAMVCISAAAIMRPESSGIITGVGTIATLVIMGLFQIAQTAKAKEETVTKLESIEKKAEVTEKTTEKMHVLIDGQRGITLRALAVALRVVADERPTPENIKAANQAEKDAADHAVAEEKVKATQLKP